MPIHDGDLRMLFVYGKLLICSTSNLGNAPYRVLHFGFLNLNHFMRRLTVLILHALYRQVVLSVVAVMK